MRRSQRADGAPPTYTRAVELDVLLSSALGRSPVEDLERYNAHVTGVAQDSRLVQQGCVFVARRGQHADGHHHVEEALARGAVAIVGELPPEQIKHRSWSGKVPYVQVADSRSAVAKLAASYYGHPSQSLTTIGVTGTDGKTTTCYLLHHILSEQFSTGLLSTAGLRLGQNELPLEGHFTTPEAPQVQSLLARFRDSGLSHAVIESSSHGLAQKRLDEVDYDVGVWTNLSAEHLDFHGSYEAYRDAKATLMRRAAASVLNLDGEDYPYFAAQAKQIVTFGLSDDAQFRALDIERSGGSLRFGLVRQGAGGSAIPVELPMIGEYNVYNALAALAAASIVGCDVGKAAMHLRSFAGVPGRMQVVQLEPFRVLVDFAHTAPALERALATASDLSPRRIIVVIGAAGERDPGKRKPLGQTATQLADFAIFTEEDSRSEAVAQILTEMAHGAEAAGGARGASFEVVPDRREAIKLAVDMAQAGDLVLLAGKGHETTLERKSEVLPWDEAAEARRVLEAQQRS